MVDKWIHITLFEEGIEIDTDNLNSNDYVDVVTTMVGTICTDFDIPLDFVLSSIKYSLEDMGIK